MEAQQVAQILDKETNIKSKYLEYEILKTDAFIIEKVAKKRKAFVENISNVTFNDLPNLRRKYQKVNLNQTFFPHEITKLTRNSFDSIYFKYEWENNKTDQSVELWPATKNNFFELKTNYYHD